MSRILFSIGKFNIYWYSFFIVIGVVIGYFLIKRDAKKQNINLTFIDNLIFYMLIIGIIGARLYYVVFNYQEFTSFIDIFKIYNGGLAIYGGVIFGISFIFYYCKKNKVNFLQILDLIVPSLILAQAIGRWGNFFNQEAYGSIVSLEYLQSLHIPSFIIDNMYINGAYHHPTFLYESILCLIGFVILIIVKNSKFNQIGTLTFIYLIYYGVIRFFIEGLRMDSLYLFSFRVSQVVSLIFVIIGIIGIIISKKKCHNLFVSN